MKRDRLNIFDFVQLFVVGFVAGSMLASWVEAANGAAPQARVYQATYFVPAGLTYGQMHRTGYVPVMWSTGGMVAYVLRIEPGEDARRVMARDDLWVKAMHPGAIPCPIDIHGGES